MESQHLEEKDKSLLLRQEIERVKHREHAMAERQDNLEEKCHQNSLAINENASNIQDTMDMVEELNNNVNWSRKRVSSQLISSLFSFLSNNCTHLKIVPLLPRRGHFFRA